MKAYPETVEILLNFNLEYLIEITLNDHLCQSLQILAQALLISSVWLWGFCVSNGKNNSMNIVLIFSILYLSSYGGEEGGKERKEER